MATHIVDDSKMSIKFANAPTHIVDDSKMSIKFANAPISWGINEFGIESGMKPDQMLDELKLAGYGGTELGDYGFFPVDKAELRNVVKSRELDMIGAFCCYALWDPKEHEKGRAYARKVAQQLKEFSDQEYPPHIVLSDNVIDPIRIKNTSKITKGMSLPEKKWKILTQEVAALKKIIQDEYGLDVHYHPHCGSFVEAPWEIEALVTDVPNLKLIFDTAHITMGAASKPMYCTDFLNRFPDRVYSFHFKDYDSNVHGKDYFDLVNNGCFPELGCGIVDFDGIKKWQRDHDFRGWIVVEQDILENVDACPLQSAIRNMGFLRNLYEERRSRM